MIDWTLMRFVANEDAEFHLRQHIKPSEPVAGQIIAYLRHIWPLRIRIQHLRLSGVKEPSHLAYSNKQNALHREQFRYLLMRINCYSNRKLKYTGNH